MDCAVVSAEVETAASSGVNPFPSSEGVQDMRLRASIHVLRSLTLASFLLAAKAPNKPNRAADEKKKKRERLRCCAKLLRLIGFIVTSKQRWYHHKQLSFLHHRVSSPL
ncbi:uncharacterized protein V6R79_022990 [Siganus canaliculatus]